MKMVGPITFHRTLVVYYINNQLTIYNNLSVTSAIIKIYTLAGKELIAKDIYLDAGKSIMDFNLKSGIYLGQIQVNEEVKTIKVLKK